MKSKAAVGTICDTCLARWQAKTTKKRTSRNYNKRQGSSSRGVNYKELYSKKIFSLLQHWYLFKFQNNLSLFGYPRMLLIRCLSIIFFLASAVISVPSVGAVALSASPSAAPSAAPPAAPSAAPFALFADSSGPGFLTPAAQFVPWVWELPFYAKR